MFLSTPMAVSTCDGSTEPDAHAEPADTHIPFWSNIIRSSSEAAPIKLICMLPGSLLYLSPLSIAYGISADILSMI